MSAFSPYYYGKGNSDPNAIECIRKDCWSQIYMFRFYDSPALKRRVIDPAHDSGLRTIVYSIPNTYVEMDGFIYLKFILCLEKEKGFSRGIDNNNGR